MLKTNTDIIDFIAQMKTVNADNDIVLLQSETYRGLFTIGTNHKLYTYSEQSNADTQFNQREIFTDCTQFAATRMGDTNYFAMALISKNNVYTCVTETPGKVISSDFLKLDFSGVLGGRKLTPVELFINSGSKDATIAVMMKNETGRIDQFIAWFSINRPTAHSYAALAANFDTIRASVCGRADRQPVDGVYTLGKYGKSDQLLYTPVLNIFSSEPPNPIRLSIPETGLECIGLCHLDHEDGTHLFGVGGNCLYIYPYERQHDCEHVSYSNYDKIGTSDYFYNPVKISSYIDQANRKLYVWILNRSGKLSYTFAPITPDGKLEDFVEPITCRDGVTFFDVTDGTLTLCLETELLFGTRGNEGGYTFNHVNIKTDTGESTVFRAFATKIITDNPGDTVRLTAPVPVEAYVNNSYYRFTNITVDSDANCVIDVIQSADDINPPLFYINPVSDKEESNERIELFAGQDCHDKLLGLNTANSIAAAEITDMQGNKVKLAAGLSDEQMKMAADTIAGLGESCNMLRAENNMSYYFNSAAAENGFWDDLKHALSEAWDYVRDKAKAFWDNTLGKAISFVTKIVSDVIHFIIKIGEEIITVVLDTAGKVLKCVVKALEFVGIPVSRILDWLLSFLDIDGAVRMKNVMKYCAEQGYKGLKNSVVYSRDYFLQKLADFLEKVEEWADLDPSVVNPPHQSSFSLDTNSSTMFLFDRIFKQGNFLSIDLPASVPPQAVMASIAQLQGVAAAHNLTDAEASVLSILDNIQDISRNITDFVSFLKKLLGLIAVKALTFAKAITELLFDILLHSLDWFWSILTTNIHIPFISAVFDFFGISEFSLLDVICIVPAFIINLIYRAAKGESLVSEEAERALKDMAFPMPPKYYEAAPMEAVPNQQANGWDNKSYNLQSMSTLAMPTGTKRVLGGILRFAMGGMYLFDGIFHCIRVFTATDNEKTIVPDVVELGINLASFGLSMGSGYGCYGPMDYNSDQATAGFNSLWFLSVGWSAATSAISIASIKCDAGDALTKIMSFCSILISVASLIAEAVAVANANALDLTQPQIVYDNVTYNMNPAVLQKDRSVFTAEVIGYCLNDVSGIVDSVLGFIKPSKIPVKGKAAICIGRGVTGLGSTVAQFVSLGYML